MTSSDASGNWGCGAFTSGRKWFQLSWPVVWMDRHITVKELLPIIIGVAIWGSRWRDQGREMPVQQCWCSGHYQLRKELGGIGNTPDEMSVLLNSKVQYSAARGAHRGRGGDTGAADALSRDGLNSFHLQVLEAQAEPTPIPSPVWEVLVDKQPNWTEVDWTRLFASIS